MSLPKVAQHGHFMPFLRVCASLEAPNGASSAPFQFWSQATFMIRRIGVSVSAFRRHRSQALCISISAFISAFQAISDAEGHLSTTFQRPASSAEPSVTVSASGAFHEPCKPALFGIPTCS